MIFNQRNKFIVLISVLSVVIGLDQWTKSIILKTFKWGESIVFIENIFAFTYVRNTGAAFGLMHNAPSYIRDPFFVIVPVIALFIILTVFIKLKEHQLWTGVSLCLILGGAIGNLIDRLRFGYVVDFIDWHWKEFYHWPAFNIADSCIVVAATFLFIQSMFQPPEKFRTH